MGKKWPKRWVDELMNFRCLDLCRMNNLGWTDTSGNNHDVISSNISNVNCCSEPTITAEQETASTV